MTDFNAKHKELYLEELKEVLKEFTNGKYGGKEEIFLEKTFNLITKFNLNDKDEVIKIINNISKHFEDNLIDIILESRYMR